jgi:aspartate/methionine/tyrosine aminotransferase
VFSLLINSRHKAYRRIEKLSPQVSERTGHFERSGIRQIMDLALSYPDVIHLEIGEPNFITPPHILEAVVAALKDAERLKTTKYSPSAGLPALRDAAARRVSSLYGVRATRENILITQGSTSGLTLAIATVANPGDEVMIPDPGWASYVAIVRAQGAKEVRYRTRQELGFVPDISDLEAALTPRTRAIIVNSPNNPTGAVYPPEAVRALYDFARRHDLWLISDESYEQLVFEGAHFSPLSVDTDGRVIQLYSFSKGYAMTGFRIGYNYAPQPVLAAMAKFQEPYALCPNTVSQHAALAALEGPQDCVRQMVASYRHRRDLAISVLRDHGLYRYTPEGAFYLLVDVSVLQEDGYQLARRLVEERRVAVSPGEAFGPAGKGFVRVSLASAEDQLLEGLRRIAQEVARKAA